MTQVMGRKEVTGGFFLGFPFFFWLHFFRAVWGSQKIEGVYRDFPYTCCTHKCRASPMINICHQMVHLLQMVNLHWLMTITQSPPFTLRLTLHVAYAVGLDKCITCIHHYGITQTQTPSSKSSVVHVFIPSPQSLITTDLFTVSIGLPFPELHTLYGLFRLPSFT